MPSLSVSSHFVSHTQIKIHFVINRQVHLIIQSNFLCKKHIQNSAQVEVFILSRPHSHTNSSFTTQDSNLARKHRFFKIIFLLTFGVSQIFDIFAKLLFSSMTFNQFASLGLDVANGYCSFQQHYLLQCQKVSCWVEVFSLSIHILRIFIKLCV